MENPIKMDDLGGTPIFGNTRISTVFEMTFCSGFFIDSTPPCTTPQG